MSFIDFKEVTSNNVGTAIRYGGNDLKEFMQILNGKVVANRRPRILNEWLWLDHFDMAPPASAPGNPTEPDSSRLYVDPTDFRIKIKKTAGGAIDIENVNIPDTALAQITDKAKLPSEIVYEDEANTYGNFAQIFLSGTAKIRNPADTFSTTIVNAAQTGNFDLTIPLLTANAEIMTASGGSQTVTSQKDFTSTGSIGLKARNTTFKIANPANTGNYIFNTSAITANQNVTLPLLAGNDTFVFEAHAQTLTNKTLGSGTALSSTLDANGFTIDDVASITMRSNDGTTLVPIAQTSNTPPVLDVHFFKDYTRQAGAPTTSSLVFGYNADWSQISFYSKWSGVNKAWVNIRADIDRVIIAATDLQFGANFRTRLRDTGLTAERIFTFPDLNGKLATDTFANTFTGTQTINKTAEAGIAEQLHFCKLSDSSSFYILENSTSVDGIFAARLRAYQTGASSNAALQIFAQIANGLDTGTAPLMVFDSRIDTQGAIATRPLFEFRNFGTPVLTVNATSFNFTNKSLINVKDIAIRNPADTFSYTIAAGAATANKTITLPNNASTSDQFLLGGASSQEIAGDKYFNNFTLQFYNPAKTFRYYVATSAITAVRGMTLPLLTADDTFVFEAHAQPLANKTISPYLDFDDTAVPANPGAGIRRMFMDTATGEMSVRTSAGTTVSLESGGGGGGALDGLTDVVITTPADNQALVYDSASSTWINEAQTGGGGGGDVFLGATNTYGDFNSLFRSSRLIVRNPANTFSYLLAGAAITADRTITFPLLTGNDVAVTEAFAQTLTNKTIVAGSNTISGIADAHISAHTSTKVTITAKGQLNSALVYNDQANTFGAFDQQFKTSRLIVRNPADTFGYLIAGSAITANRTVTLPLLAGNDTAVMEAFTQTLTNKTLTTPIIASISNSGTITVPTGTDTLVARATTDTLTNKTVNTTDNTVTATSQATGDILKNNGTKFVRLARGTSLQVLRVNSGATDLEYASLDSERVGKSTANGNGSTTVFNIAHGLGSTPTYAFVSVAQSGTTSPAIARSYTVDTTNIVVTFASAPSSGTNNVIIYWRVVA